MRANLGGTIFPVPNPRGKAPVKKNTTPIQDSAAALQSPEAEALERQQQRANRSDEPARSNKSQGIDQAARANHSQGATVNTGAKPRLGGLRRKLEGSPMEMGEAETEVDEGEQKRKDILTPGNNHPEPMFKPIQKDEERSVRKGDLTNEIRLATGHDKILVNHRKLTDKVSSILQKIEAEGSYLDSLAQKIAKKKHVGIVIDLPRRNSTVEHSQDEEGEEFAIGYLIDEDDNKKSGS